MIAHSRSYRLARSALAALRAATLVRPASDLLGPHRGAWVQSMDTRGHRIIRQGAGTLAARHQAAGAAPALVANKTITEKSSGASRESLYKLAEGLRRRASYTYKREEHTGDRVKTGGAQ